ncbi:MAG: ThuA domain-containing protein [Gemmatimonadetes bacterium]|nr:ThuA domain-containing protein [Gemmatimonadota bacterium]
MAAPALSRTGSWSAPLVSLLAIALVGCAPATPTPRAAPTAAATEAKQQRIKVLFLGDAGHHTPAERLRDVGTSMLNRGIELYYTERLADLNPENLRGYDAVLLYANYEGDLPRAQEEALLAYVAEGGGFVPVHSASGNFRTSRAFIELLGGAFASHGTGVFRTRIAEPDHGIMQGFRGFESWDETYVHKDHNPQGRTVLEYRENEPYTWTRSHGRGRVFYTAWGHDKRTWQNTGFHDLLERGIRWAAGQSVQQALTAREVEEPFEHAVLDVPFPPPHSARLEYEATKGPMDRRSNYPLFYNMQLAMTPEESMRRMVLPAGFRVELFASEPDVVNPIAFDWDERGRLWVAESVEYPYPREIWPDSGGKDRIKILEDTDNDGRADKVTVFAGDMNIPTGFTFANGGVVVVQAPQTLFLKDTDGDDRADVRQVLFEGWSQRDTHAGPSNLHYGLDNWVWGVLGYSGFTGTVGGEQHQFSQGVYRFARNGSKLEFLRRTNNNTWGLGFNEQGGAFVSTANGNPSTYLQFPQKNYSLLSELQAGVTETLSPTPRMIPLSNEFRQVDWVGAYTAGSDHPVYTARSFPRPYWNRIGFVAEPTGHLVGEFILEPAGSTYDATHPRNLVTSDDQWFSPVAVEVGPDGAIWLADWYNYVIQHNAESDRQRPSPGNAYANPLRDRQHGRIYRIVHEGAAPVQPMTLAGAGPQKLVETLRHENRFWRIHAQRLLVERGQTDVVPALIELARDRGVDAVGLNAAVIHALWTLHGLGQIAGSNDQALTAARAALTHPSPGVRINATKVLPRNSTSAEAVLPLLADPDPQVRLEALVALGEMPSSLAAGEAIYSLLGQPSTMQDQWLREAGALAGAVHSRGFLAAARASGLLARATAPRPEPANLLPDPGFERTTGAQPSGWTSRTDRGSAQLVTAPGRGRSGGNALRIGSTAGADASWLGPEIQLKPNTRYQIGAWIRTNDVVRGTARGAQISMGGIPAAISRTNPMVGTNDWTYQERTFTAPAAATGRLEVTLGGGGDVTGELLLDDVLVRELGPEPGQTLPSIVELVAKSSPQYVNEQDVAGPAQASIGGNAVVLAVAVVPEVLQFDKKELRVRAGQQVSVVFTNTDNMEHNFVVIMPNSLTRVGPLADQLAASPRGREQNYVPDTPDVVVNTPILGPSEKFTLNFVAPTTPGTYEFVCTIPGHWRVMRGVFVVEPA